VPVLRARTRVVYFRLSEDEFQRFSELCKDSSARSISDLARTIVRRALEGRASTGEPALRDLIQRLTGLVESLEERLPDSKIMASAAGATEPIAFNHSARTQQ